VNGDYNEFDAFCPFPVLRLHQIGPLLIAVNTPNVRDSAIGDRVFLLSVIHMRMITHLAVP
jgi:hypothetical protein